MKKNTYFLLGIVGLAAILIIGLNTSAPWKSSAQKSRQIDQDGLESRKLSYERYSPSTILQLEYGDGDKQVGLISGVEDFRPMGPLSFAVKGEEVYILDEVNEKAKVFTPTGELIRSVQVDEGSSDLAVDSSDRLYVLDSRTNSIAEYDVGSYLPTRIAVNQPVSDLSADPEGVVSAKMRDSSTYSLVESTGKRNWRLSLEPYTCIKVGDHLGKVINNSTGKAFQVSTEDYFGSISYLGSDREQNIYVVVEELLPSDTIQVKKEVRKYSRGGRQIAEIPVNIDYVAHPEKELILDADGSVYHLLPMKDHLIVEKWSKQY